MLVNCNWLSLIVVKCDQLYELRSIAWIVINCLNCDQLPELRSIAWIAINCLNCNQLPELQSIAWIAIDCLNCDQLPELRSIIWVVIDCTSCDLLYELQHCPTILRIGSDCTQFRSLHIMTCNCNYLSSFSGLQAIGTLLQSVFLCNWSLILPIDNIVL